MELARVSRVAGPAIGAAVALVITGCPAPPREPDPMFACKCVANYPDGTTMEIHTLICTVSASACNTLCSAEPPPGAISAWGSPISSDAFVCRTGAAGATLLARETYEDAIVGGVVSELSDIIVASEGETGVTQPFGADAVWISGGDCPGAACGFDIHWFRVRGQDFDIGGVPAEDFNVIANGQWHGQKSADNSYVITVPSPPTAYGFGYIDGTRASKKVTAMDPIQGHIFFEGPDPHMTIDGIFNDDGTTIDTFTYIEFDRGSPRPRGTWTWDSGSGKYKFWAWLITAPLGFNEGQLGYSWYAKAGTQGEYKFGSGKTLWVNKLPPFPIKVVVSNPDGFKGKYTINK
jgi:hypothetical protein